MSESLCKLIKRYEGKKHYGLCVLSLFLLMWVVVAFTGFAEIQSLFSNKHLGVIEAFLFTQIDLLSFQRSGIEILPDNSWRSISSDTILDSFGYWYNAIYLAMWFLVFRLLISKELNALILDVDLNKAANSLRSISGKLKSYLMKEAHGIKKYSSKDLINRSISKNVPTNNTLKGVHDVNLERKASEYTNDKEDEPEHKQCPYCCEQILYRAIKCKHCGSDLTKIIQRQHSGNEILSDVSCPRCFSDNVVKFRGFWIWFFAIILFPVGLLLLLLPARRYCLDCDFKFKQ